MYQAVFIRHGQSDWNKRNLVTGWTDVDLSPEGDAEAQRHDLRCSQRLRDPHVGRERRDLAVTRLLKHEHGVAQGVEQGGRQGLE